MLGKYFFWGVVSIAVIIIGMLLFPTVHTNWDGISTVGWSDLEVAGGLILSYGFIFFMIYIVWVHVRR